jgi:hypothetical protein
VLTQPALGQWRGSVGPAAPLGSSSGAGIGGRGETQSDTFDPPEPPALEDPGEPAFRPGPDAAAIGVVGEVRPVITSTQMILRTRSDRSRVGSDTGSIHSHFPLPLLSALWYKSFVFGTARLSATAPTGHQSLWARSRCRLVGVGMLVAGYVASLGGCHRELPPSPTDEACEATCTSLSCFTPGVDDAVLDQCQSNCKKKIDESSRQGSDCNAAFEDGLECLSDLSCEQFMDWYSSSEADPCPSARTDVANSCQGLYLEPEILPP